VSDLDWAAGVGVVIGHGTEESGGLENEVKWLAMVVSLIVDRLVLLGALVAA
jgi:hypothetical protein